MFLLSLCVGEPETLFKQRLHSQWEYHTLNDKETTNREAEKKEEFIYQGLGDTLSDVIHVGDNFAVNAEEGNSEGLIFIY